MKWEKAYKHHRAGGGINKTRPRCADVFDVG